MIKRLFFAPQEAEATAREAIDKWRGNAAAWLQLSEVLVDMVRKGWMYSPVAARVRFPPCCRLAHAALKSVSHSYVVLRHQIASFRVFLCQTCTDGSVHAKPWRGMGASALRTTVRFSCGD